jgi:hypothetical protein
MRRIDTHGHSTQVVDRVALRYRPNVELIRDAVSPKLCPLAGDLAVEQAVPVGVKCPFPQPAVRSAPNFPCEPLLLILRRWTHCHAGNHTTKYTEWIGRQLLTALGVAA